MGEKKCIKLLIAKAEGRKICGRPSLRWEDNIKIDLQERGWIVD